MLDKDQSDGQSIVLSSVELKPGYLYFWEVGMPCPQLSLARSRLLTRPSLVQMIVEGGFAGIMLGVANPTVPLATQLGSDSSGWAFTGGASNYAPHSPALVAPPI